MSRTEAKFQQADIARAIRAAKQTGAGSVELTSAGNIIINVNSGKQNKAIDKEEEIVL